MGDLWTTFVAAVIAFIATNIDDIVLITVFYTQVSANFRKRHIVLGQYMGFAAILAFSLLGFFGALVIPESIIGLLGIAPIYMGLRQLFGRGDDDDDEDEASVLTEKSNSPLATLFSPQVIGVAAVTVANGGDNIGVYIPLFAGRTVAEVGIIFGVFAVLIAVMCLISDRLGSHPALAHLLENYGHIIVPFVLIGLGIYILAESGTFALLWKLVTRGAP